VFGLYKRKQFCYAGFIKKFSLNLMNAKKAKVAILVFSLFSDSGLTYYVLAFEK